jgi:hypothetical protein
MAPTLERVAFPTWLTLSAALTSVPASINVLFLVQHNQARLAGAVRPIRGVSVECPLQAIQVLSVLFAQKTNNSYPFLHLTAAVRGAMSAETMPLVFSGSVRYECSR